MPQIGRWQAEEVCGSEPGFAGPIGGRRVPAQTLGWQGCFCRNFSEAVVFHFAGGFRPDWIVKKWKARPYGWHSWWDLFVHGAFNSSTKRAPRGGVTSGLLHGRLAVGGRVRYCREVQKAELGLTSTTRSTESMWVLRDGTGVSGRRPAMLPLPPKMWGKILSSRLRGESWGILP